MCGQVIYTPLSSSCQVVVKSLSSFTGIYITDIVPGIIAASVVKAGIGLI